jgi:amylosucrase
MTIETARKALADLLNDDAESTEALARFDRWAPDLLSGLREVYDSEVVLASLVPIMASAIKNRSTALHVRDRQRILEPDWFQRPDAVGYVAYADQFADDLPGVHKRIDYLVDLGITSLHLMPILRPRPGENDGGYAVMDYRAIRSDLGTMDDLATLTAALHEAGIALTLDLVINHVAREHAWADAARSGDQRYRDYFWIFPERAEVEAFERSLPEVFPSFAPGNFTFDEELNAWVWTTFNTWQWDLNWANPAVFCEFADIVAFLANQGVDCLRLDAIAFIWKRLGTSCQGQPEVHAITQALRAFARIVAPAMIFKAEAIVGPQEVVAYLGQGRYAGKVSELAYHNSLMVQIWSAFAARDGRLMAHALNRFPAIPTDTCWATYLRCHDDIGWAIDDGDAGAVGWSGFAHRAFLADFYAGDFEGSFASGAHFQINSLTGDRRTSGTAASLAGVEQAGVDPERLDVALDRLMCMTAMVLGFGGLPLIYMGDELALVNDWSFQADPARSDDNRWMHRPAMPWDAVTGLGTATNPAARVFRRTKHLIAVRKRLPALHAATPTVIHIGSTPSVVMFRRDHPAGDLVEVYNVSEHSQPFAASECFESGPLREHISGRLVTDAETVIPAYAAWWFTRA